MSAVPKRTAGRIQRPVAGGSPRVAVVCDQDLIDWLDRVALAEDRSRNYVIVRILRAAKKAAGGQP